LRRVKSGVWIDAELARDANGRLGARGAAGS
jgi:hypothetical protein